MNLLGRLTMPNYNFEEASRTLDRICKFAKRFMAHAATFPHRPCYRSANESHVISMARSFRSPYTHMNILLNVFTNDPDFVKIIPKDEFPLVLEVGTDGNEVRANFYPIVSDLPDDPYDPKWPETGVFRFQIDDTGEVEPIIRKKSYVRYDRSDVIYSYARWLNDEERRQLLTLLR